MARPLHPPKFAQRVLLWFLRPDLAEEVLGDLDEKFYSSVMKFSRWRAGLNYWYQVLNYLRPFAFKRKITYNLNSYFMYQSYFRVGWRNLLRDKGYATLNIAGLSVGMAVAMIIGLWIYDEMTFNHAHTNHARIAQIVRHGTLNGTTYTNGYLPYGLVDEVKEKYGSHFTHVTAYWPAGDHTVATEEKAFTMRGAFIEDVAPAMFSFDIKAGSINGLTEQNAIMLSASAARTLFGESDPINKVMKIDNVMDVKVTGVFNDFPGNSQFQDVKFFAPWKLFVSHNSWMTTQGFSNNFLHMFVAIPESATFESASYNIKDAILNNVQEDPGYVKINPQLELHPMDRWHLYAEWTNGVNNGGAITFVRLFAVVGIFVLILACINFMNLSTARSERRAREVGIRKTLGSIRSQIITQFFSESFLIVIISLVFALVCMAVALPWFNFIAGKDIHLPFQNLYFWAATATFVVITGVVAGSYPAFYLSSFLPVKVLKGTFKSGRFAALPRKVLVVVQFTVSVMLVVGTITVYKQINYAKDRPVGYNREGLVMIQMTSPDFYGKLDVLETELKAAGVATDIAQSTGPTTGIWSSNGGFEWRDKPPGYQEEFATISVTAGYGKTVGWEFVAGRDFKKELASDSTAVIISEKTAKILGFENPLGEVVRWTPWGLDRPIDFTVIGVVKDMVMRSPFVPEMPTFFFIAGPQNWLNIRLDPRLPVAQALPGVEKVFKRVIPNAPFAYKFASEEYAMKFAAEERIGNLAAVFTTLAIFISCVGLFGLTSFIASQRTKEIGIRKVLGASVVSVWRLLSGQFMMMVLIACLLAVPLSAWYMQGWLEKYDYRIAVGLDIFVIATVGAFAIALITVSAQALKAAFQDPVKSLRTE